MSKMRSLSLDDGLESFMINNDKDRVIRFNPSDPNLLQRYHQAMKDIDDAKDKIGGDIQLDPNGEPVEDDPTGAVAATLRETDDTIRKSLNYMLNADVYDTVFGRQSPFCMIKGEYLFEKFLNCIGPVIKDAIAESVKASEARKNKYLKGYKK